MVRYIISLVLESWHAAKDSNRKLFSASILQLQSMHLFINMYGWLGITIGRSLLVVQIICLSIWPICKNYFITTIEHCWSNV